MQQTPVLSQPIGNNRPARLTLDLHPPVKSVAILLLACLLQSCGADQNGATEAVADAAPAATSTATSTTAPLPVIATFDAANSTFQDLQGRGLELASFAGKRVFVNYWATWCAPCIREIPSLNRAASELEDENTLFLLASDESIETINNFILDRSFAGNFIKLNGFFGSHGIDVMPSSSLYDEQGQLLQSWIGAYEWDSAEMLAQIRSAKAVTDTSPQ